MRMCAAVMHHTDGSARFCRSDVRQNVGDLECVSARCQRLPRNRRHWLDLPITQVTSHTVIGTARGSESDEIGGVDAERSASKTSRRS